MKYTTIYRGENTIELHNSLLGKETVKVNGEVVSSKFSWMGTEHTFTVKENDADASYKLVTGFGFSGVVIDLYQDGKPLIESPKSGCLGILLIVLIVLALLLTIERLF